MDNGELVTESLFVRLCGVTVAAGDRAEPFLRKVNFIRHLPGDLPEYINICRILKGGQAKRPGGAFGLYKVVILLNIFGGL